MEINNKKQIVTTCDELLNHAEWHELINARHKVKGHGNRIFRVFELDCGSGYKISIALTESIGFSFSSQAFSKPYITVLFTTKYGTSSYRRTIISDCQNREEFYLKLYNHLAKRFPLTDLDVQSIKVA